MIATLDHHTSSTPVSQGSPDGSRAGQVERRRPGRLANPSPELIALMRQPTDEARRKLALYDAPNFVLPAEVASTRASPMHSLRMLCAVSVCIGAWGGVFTAMMVAWG